MSILINSWVINPKLFRLIFNIKTVGPARKTKARKTKANTVLKLLSLLIPLCNPRYTDTEKIVAQNRITNT